MTLPASRRGRLSPIPSLTRATTNGSSHTEGSVGNGDAPRLSISGRSKKSGADFEAALLNPTRTIFLSAGPDLEEDGISPRIEGDSPIPVEKRSYEDDLKLAGRTTPDRVTKEPVDDRTTPKVEEGVFGVIPPTPTPGGPTFSTPRKGDLRDRRISQGTMRSQDTSYGSPSRLSTISASSSQKGSVGLDAELNETQKMGKPTTTKRRSMFRSPGTASSPDLATLVRKAKEAKATVPSHVTHDVPQSAYPANPPATLTTSQSSGRVGLPTLSTQTIRGAPVSSDGLPRADQRSASSSSAMPVISERPARSRENSSEGSKSLRNKARGVFGRMFGGPSSREHTPTTSPNTITTPRFNSPGAAQPPVPPVPASYQREADARRRVTGPSTPNTVVSPPNDTPTISEQPEPTADGRQNTTPTAQSIVGDTDKPLPPLLPNPSSPSLHRGTLHRRQPAGHDDSEPIGLFPRRRPVTMSFSDDVAGIFDSIGQSDPAKELGLPPDSLRLRDRTASANSGLPTKKFPTDLGRSMSIDSPRKERLAVPSPITQRTSSLPRNSSPKGTPGAPLSRSSSASSSTHQHPSLTLPDLGSPIRVNSSDFGPDMNGHADTTIKARTETPASMRLVTSPRVDDVKGLNIITETLAKSTFTSQPLLAKPPIEEAVTPTTPTRPPGEDAEEKGRRLACEFLDDDFSSIQRDKVAEFLGGPRRVNTVALTNYMLYFNMKGQTLVEAFRDLCAKLHLRAESQEIDRIIEAFSARFYECNPTTVFGSQDVVHTVTGAMLMLNTDLHIAELSKHMSRADFVRNAMRAIQESASGFGESTPDLGDDSGSARLSTTRRVPAPRSASAPVASAAPPSTNSDRSVSTATTRPSTGSVHSKAWESEAETALKDIFNQVRADKILLPTNNISNRQSVISLGSEYRGSSMRSPSGRSNNDRVNALKRGSIRGMQGLMNNPYGSNSAFSSDGRLSPTPSYATTDSAFATTIGFASNLSHTVIREHDDEKDGAASRTSLETTDEELDDDELALLGAPWAKEGMVWRRAGGEASMKKVSKKDWKQYFGVVQQGEMLLFTFGEGSSSGSFGAVGGGNWLNNANAAGRYSLVHASVTSVRGGYGKDRPHVLCLSLPSETLYLAAGTDELVTEWVQTCKYWSARRSRQPLQGGVSNVEYGWNRVTDSYHHDQPTSPEDDRASVKSGRSNLSRFNSATYGRKSFNATPGDRLWINDWKPPQPSLMPSPLDEEAQMDALTTYAKTLNEEFETHKKLEEPMMKLYSHNSKNAQKAHANWAAKSKYLLGETHKYYGYVKTLHEAFALRVKTQGERKFEKSLARSTTSLHRRESQDASRAMAQGSPVSKAGLRGRRDVPLGLAVGTERDEDEGETALTPTAARRNGH